MPTYEYKCLDCGKTFEEFQNINDPEIQNCYFCSGNVKRLISAGAGLIFRGSGFYCTDYRNDNNKNKTNGSSSDNKEKSDSGSNQQQEKTTPSGSQQSNTANNTAAKGSDDK